MRDHAELTKTLLVTGGAGFIGSNFIPFFLEQHPNYEVINVDKLTYAGNKNNVRELDSHPRCRFIKGDINNRELMNCIFEKYNISGVIHFAAESHVDNSISGPDAFIQTNINGTFTLLEAARNHWMRLPFHSKEGYQDSRFHHISTDEVYGSLSSGSFIEESAYAPSNPYSASKAGSDLIVQSYHKTYGINTIITHSSNNYGPKQHPEKFIPTIISHALAGEAIPLYGDGRNIRDWIYVFDHCKAIDLVYHQGLPGETYNIGQR